MRMHHGLGWGRMRGTSSCQTRPTHPPCTTTGCCPLSAGALVTAVAVWLCLLSRAVQAAPEDADATDATQSAAAMAAVQQQQQQFMSMQLSGVSPLVETRYTWTVSSKANVKSIQVPVDSEVGWPQVK